MWIGGDVEKSPHELRDGTRIPWWVGGVWMTRGSEDNRDQEVLGGGWQGWWPRAEGLSQPVRFPDPNSKSSPTVPEPSARPCPRTCGRVIAPLRRCNHRPQPSHRPPQKRGPSGVLGWRKGRQLSGRRSDLRVRPPGRSGSGRHGAHECTLVLKLQPRPAFPLESGA